MRLLVASHDASRTGAPLLLLTFLRWVRRKTDAEVQLVLWRGGPLVPAFAEVAEVTVLHPPPGERSVAETVELGLEKVGLVRMARRLTAVRVRARLRVHPHDVLYLNGAGSALVLPHLAPGTPSLAHVHELTRGLTFSLRGPGRERFLGADRVVAVAQVVAEVLARDWGVDPERIMVLSGCVPDRVGTRHGGETVMAEGKPLVASVGAGSWRKGVDLFLQVAAGVRGKVGDEVRFAWIGPLDDEGAVRSAAEALGLSDGLSLPGTVEDPSTWFSAMTVFCSTAREDPFPLVALEAGEAGVPVVAFDSGGVTELLADGCGTVVGPEAVAAMVDAVAAHLEDPTVGRLVAERLQARVRADHTIEAMGPALWRELERVYEGGRSL